MNKLLPLIILLFYCTLNISAQNYHEDDKEGLRSFLRQPSSIDGRFNFECLGLSTIDTINWKASEDWIDKIHTSISPVYLDIEWNLESQARLARLEVKVLYNYLDSSTEVLLLSGTLDCSKFSALRYLNCSNNNLTKLKISQNLKLDELHCGNNKLSDLDISKNTNLTALSCFGNILRTLDVSENKYLRMLDCSNNQLDSINPIGSKYIKYLFCSNNSINNLDLLLNSELETLVCSNNSLSTLDLTLNPELSLVFCSNNALNNLDVSVNTKIKNLNCSKNNLNTLDISLNTEMQTLNCAHNKLDNLNLQENTSLQYLYCNDNELAALNTSKNKELLVFNYSNNKSNTFDVSNNKKVEYLACANNELEDLDLSKNEKLVTLDCSFNKLSTLDLLSNIYLSELNCSNNRLTKIETDQCESFFRSLICNNNKLRFSTLPVDFYSYYKTLVYSPQDSIVGGDIYPNNEIDLSSEHNINSTFSTYNWLLLNDCAPVTVTDNGKFAIGYEYEDKSLLCKVTNDKFPNLELIYTFNILKDIVSVVDDKEQHPNVLIYPNPVIDIFGINTPESINNIEIHNITGTLVRKIQNVEVNNINISELQTGVYLVKIITHSGKTFIQKITKR